MLIGTLWTDSARRVAVTMTSSNVPDGLALGVACAAAAPWASAAGESTMTCQATRTPLSSKRVASFLSLSMVAPFHFCVEVTIIVVTKRHSPNDRYQVAHGRRDSNGPSLADYAVAAMYKMGQSL